jgi:capsular exopolysaccharide synthesis family protein
MGDLPADREVRPAAVQPPPWVEERQASLRDYLDIVGRRWRIVAGTFLAALGVAVAISLMMPPIYRASTTVTTDKTPPMVLLDKPGEFSVSADQGAGQAPDVLTLVELIKSDAVRDGAAFRLAPTVSSDMAGAALNGLTVQQVRQTELVRINIEYVDPRIAAEAANAVADSLVEMNLKARRQRATETREFIGRELQAANRRLRHVEDTLVAFRDRLGDVSLSQETTLTLQKLADLQAQLVDVRLQREIAQSHLAAARGRLANQADAMPTAPNPVIAVLKEELAKLEIELSGLRLEFTPKHPAILSTSAKIEETKQRLNAELTKSLRGELAQVEVSMASLSGRERAVQNVITAYAERMRGLPVREVDMARLTRDVKESEQIYLLLSDKYEHARIAENSIGSVIRVMGAAKVPNAAVKPRRQMNTLFGGLLGIMVGIAGALLAEQLDDTVKSAEEIERVLGAPVLGAIPLSRAQPMSKHSTQKEETAILPLLAVTDRRAAEAYRALRTHVLYSMPDIDRKRLLVTSALPREGKSTVVANLAVAIAHTSRRVWLIDSDLRRPTLWNWFGGAGSPGLAGLLAGQTEADSVVRSTVEPNLWYLESGPTVPNPAELLGSQRMVRLMERARAEAEVVLVDSPPMLPVTDAEVVAAQAVDGVLLVVRAGLTNRRALAHVRKRLERVGAKLVGAVLNGVSERGRDSYYYGSYYYASDGPEGKDSRGKIGSEREDDQGRRERA